MSTFSLEIDAAAFRDLQAEYLAQLVAPMDDMWAAFADQATPYALRWNGELAGCCAVDDEGRLLRFYVKPRFQLRSQELMRRVIDAAGVKQLMVFTLDPSCLSTALDLVSASESPTVESHSLLFALLSEPEGPGLEPVRMGELHDHERLIAFEQAAMGAPREFLEPYLRERLERQELLMFEEGDRLLCVGELRRDARQAGVAQLGMVVHRDARRQGLATRMLTRLVNQSREAELVPCCSTEVSNVGARRAIERSGFRARHRLLRISGLSGESQFAS
ncbi:MAG: GNAT family N-acetyltransferase [Acidobacteriota bacterium]